MASGDYRYNTKACLYKAGIADPKTPMIHIERLTSKELLLK
jgi:hypothetical protein